MRVVPLGEMDIYIYIMGNVAGEKVRAVRRTADAADSSGEE
jgi:hypothetical protein